MDGPRDGTSSEPPIVTLELMKVPENSRRQGIGSDVMAEIIKWADDNHYLLALSPSSDFGTKVTILRKFYKSFGFIPNKGRNKDFRTLRTMIRYPKTARTSYKRSHKFDKSNICDEMGFSEKASCRPYKNCYKVAALRVIASENVPTNKRLWGKVIQLTKGEISKLNHNGDMVEGPNGGSGFNKYPCVPLSAKAMTQSGWVSFSDLRVGDLILGLEPEKKVWFWTKIKKLHCHSNASLVRLHSAHHNFDFVCTENHNWVVVTENGFASKETTSLSDNDVIVTAMHTTVPVSHLELEYYGSDFVWCPETETGNWYMKQNDRVTLTGNSAYANGWASLTYKNLGGGWKKKAFYGVPTEEHQKIMDKGLPDIYDFPIPYVSHLSFDLEKELEVLEELMVHEREHHKDFIRMVDEDLETCFRLGCEYHGLIYPQGWITSVITDLNVLIMQLKYKYNRIRPFQFARMVQSPFRPMNTVSGHTPSYPSGHTIQAMVIAHLLGREYKEHATMFARIAKMTSYSRLLGGYHWPTDVAYGEMIAKTIINGKGKTAKGKVRRSPKKDVGHGGLDEWFSGHGDSDGDATWGDWVAISPVKKTIKIDSGKDKKINPGDIIGPCGISDDPVWRDLTDNGEDPLKCMPRNKAYNLSKKERADIAKNKLKEEKKDKSKEKTPTFTRTFKKKKEG